MSFKPRYSGPDRSGVCVCGHRWDEHHLSLIIKIPEHEIPEAYIPQECEHYGFNEMGGLDDEGNYHCYGYKDTLDNE